MVHSIRIYELKNTLVLFRCGNYGCMTKSAPDSSIGEPSCVHLEKPSFSLPDKGFS
jgi:hypothetical protein